MERAVVVWTASRPKNSIASSEQSPESRRANTSLDRELAIVPIAGAITLALLLITFKAE
jgi:hypothetical protein